MNAEFRRHDLTLDPGLAGLRLDQALARLLPQYSRSRIQGWIERGTVQIDGRTARARDRVLGGEHVALEGEVPADTAHAALVALLAERDISREYLAVATGVMTGGGTIDEPIGRHKSVRVKMAVRQGGRAAVTHYRVVERFRSHTLARVMLETGRTHQIRVHLAHAGFPVLGDPVYGGRRRLPAGASPALLAALQAFPRQALHAARLAFVHPASGEELEFEAPLPADMQALIAMLRADSP